MPLPATLLKWSVTMMLVTSTLAACTSHSFKRRTPFEKTSNGFWYRADCDGPCGLLGEAEEQERLRKLNETLRRENACPNGYVIDKRTPLAVTPTALPDIVVYEGRCTG